MDYPTVHARLKKGWTTDQIANTPVSDGFERIEYNGRMYTYRELAAINHLPQDVVYYRINRYYWDIDRAISEPLRTNPVYTVDGISASPTEWAKAAGIYPDVILARIKRGKTVEEAIFTPGKHSNVIYFIDENNKPISQDEY